MDSLRIFVDLALPSDALELLKAGTVGHELVFPTRPATSILSSGKPDRQLALADVVFGQPNVASMADAERLRWAHISSAGITRYDTPEFRALMSARGIAVTNSSSVFYEACAVHALSFLLAHTRRLPLALGSRAASKTVAWRNLRATSGTLQGEVILLMGYGAIGQRLAELLRPFDVTLFGFRRLARGDEGIPVVTESDLPAALTQADHVVNILPESSETRRFFTADRFAAMKRGAVFYNLGRGETVDQNSLLEALRSGQVGAAWLDVTSPEPLPDDHPLRAEPNCFITPHVAGGHREESSTLVRHFLANVSRFIGGKALLNRVM